MTSAPLYVGIDLGTTNSTAAVFDGEKVTLVRNAQGSPITPSVVRIDARGNVTVGAKARRFLDTDAENTRSEFKRLMGTAQGIRFGAAGLERRPEELAAEVLRSLRADVRDQIGVLPARAVISVPALFELPQTSATSEAARLAGFERVELLQEPIASALAAGWTIEDQGGAWLVYDLGGGTFDVSLLETRDGLLRVVGHDGDNFLGGRDFDWAIVDWAIAQAARDGVVIRRGDPAHAAAVRKIKLAAEEAKIELSRAESASITVPGLDVGGASHDLDVTLDRETLERLCAPAIDRSIAVCRRLLQAHGVADGGLTRVVLVGGPSVMPVVRRLVSQQLSVPPAEGLDPMTLVAQGAAIFAATAGLEARPSAIEQVRGAKVWLQYPAMSSDLTPHVVGRLVERTGPVNSVPTEIQLARADGLWDSPWTPLDEEGAFVLPVSLVPRKPNVFRLTGKNIQGNAVTIDPPTLTIVQGLTISDPPLSRTIGVALASNDVRVYFERGAPLPARRTFTLHTVDSVARGAEKAVIKIPIVQGEYEQAHLCRLVGALEIGGKELKQTLASGAEVELTIELDRGGRMSARALIPAIGQVFEHVAHLLVPEADPEVLASTVTATRARLGELRTDAFRRQARDSIERLGQVESALDDVGRDIDAARGGDTDAAQKARRTLIEVDAQIEAVELDRRWPELDREAREALIWTTGWVQDYGQPHEQTLYQETAKAVDKARQARDPLELQRQLRLLRRLGSSAYGRHPEAWKHRFEDAAADAGNATDVARAQALVKEGREALAKGDNEALRRVTQKLWQLLPSAAEDRRKGHESGVR
ncbi:Hsp70 family protein [Nannocystis sp. ILAH1]|uniref:Hsp70 family protein n=1 Tax=unclassified Nannocystis TaxID=2627009 RepID=UPI00226D874B|nr:MULTISPECIES: Hsp70 family protein [unclassified Nannocystis]MCY0990287.1 Hsp70 family protein [Nannocystis sp. ILAH1]MCY1069424.1 Hsp70 family protein [Nannocystis sp. RBIL2]